MFITRNLSFKQFRSWHTWNFLGLLAFNGIVAVAYAHKYLAVGIPWLPVSVIGTAVAFYLTFKNNQAYDRMWEARKLWGGIVNSSRTWGMMVMSYVRAVDEADGERVAAIRRTLIHRQIAWLYQHRKQLLEPMTWEQVGATDRVGALARSYDRLTGLGAFPTGVHVPEPATLLDPQEAQRMQGCANPAAQLINAQALQLAELREAGNLIDLRHVEMGNVLKSFYDLQGGNERIKKFPFPRDYSSMSQAIIYLFVVLVPFSLIPEMLTVGHWAFWLSIPISTLIGLVFIIMEVVGDYNENPFMGTPNGMPMLSMCRSIEIDLRQMLGEQELPKPIAPVNGVLM